MCLARLRNSEEAGVASVSRVSKESGWGCSREVTDRQVSDGVVVRVRAMTFTGGGRGLPQRVWNREKR